MSGIMDDAKKQAALAAEARRAGIPEWQMEMARAVGNDLVRNIVADNRAQPEGPSSLIPRSSRDHAEPIPKGSGETPIKPVDGVRWIDQIADHFAALDRLERERRLKGGP
jgi:hypothetical protein